MKELRGSVGITQEQIAKAMGLKSRQIYSLIELGRRPLLDPSEFDGFYDIFNAAGIPDEVVAEAYHNSRCRSIS